MLSRVIQQIKDIIQLLVKREEAEDPWLVVVCPTAELLMLPTGPGATNGVLSNNNVCTNVCVTV